MFRDIQSTLKYIQIMYIRLCCLSYFLIQFKAESNGENKAQTNTHTYALVCACVCACVRERDRAGETNECKV